MTGMREDLERHLNHRQPRDRRDHEPATGVNAGTPSDRDGADDAPDEAKGVSSPAPVAVNEALYECPRCCHVAPWTDGRTAEAGDPYDEFWCQRCGEETPLADLVPNHLLTPADPHTHDWADLGKPGLHGSVCRACGETQID